MKYNKNLSQIIEDISEVAGYLWTKGWAERNGGNISCNITHVVGSSVKSLDPISKPIEIHKKLSNIIGCYFFVKGTGKRMRDLAKNPFDNASIVRICNDGEHYEIVAEKPVMPTSEMVSHLAIHDFLIQDRSTYKAVIHTHPTDLVAMTHNPDFLYKDVLTKLLWSMIPETRAFCPKGVGIVRYAMPGSVKLADDTLEQLKTYDVVLWEKHGALSVGENIKEAFDMIDTLSKSAQIYLIARQMGFAPTGLTDEQMDEMMGNMH